MDKNFLMKSLCFFDNIETSYGIVVAECFFDSNDSQESIQKVEIEFMSGGIYRLFCSDKVSFCEGKPSKFDNYRDMLRAVINAEITSDVQVSDKFVHDFSFKCKESVTVYRRIEILVIDVNDGRCLLFCTLSDINDLMNKYVEKKMDYEALFSIATMSVDVLFSYKIATGAMELMYNLNGEFNHKAVIENYRTEFEKQIYAEDMPIFKQFCDNLENGTKIMYYEMRIFDEQSNDYLWNKIQGRTNCDDSGKPIIVVGDFVNISHHKDAERRLIEKSERDSLTQIYNKTTTRSLIKNYLRHDSKSIFDALIIIDVDNFKAINDSLGHMFGDSVLSDLSQEMQDLFRSSDVVGRIGGDEFLIFLRGVKIKKHIEEKATDLCKIFDLLYCGEMGEKITGSLGIAVFPTDGDTFEVLFEKADTALYTSKQKGKNCYTFYEDLDEADKDKKYINSYCDNAILPSSNNVFALEITDFAFDIMNKTKDVSSAINMLLSKVGKHFGLDSVCILEREEYSYALRFTYTWNTEMKSVRDMKLIEYTETEWKNMLASYDENDIISFSDKNNVKPYCTKTSCSKTKSHLECQILDSGDYKGCVCFSDCVNHHEWSIEEVRAIKTITKIIASYLLKMRAFDNANRLVDILTNYDKLTNLPRMNRFKAIVSDYVERNGRSQTLAMVYSDIDNFKYINEKYGISNGDRVLKTFAERSELLDIDTISNCRVFSDKFMMLVRYDTVEQLRSVLMNFFVQFAFSEKHDTTESSITISCGIYLINGEDFNVEIAVDNVNIARKEAKQISENSCVVYTEVMKEEINYAIEIVARAKLALQNNEFVVYFQSKVDLKRHKIAGAEALVRWKKPNGDIIPPMEFIPYLEKSDYITNLDYYVYRRVCEYIAAKIQHKESLVPISVNVSRVHLKNPNFTSNIKVLVDSYDIPHQYIEFELTESVFLENEATAINVMMEIKSMGFRVSIDDFGAGYSSLNLLKNLPADVLKLDKEFFGNGVFKTNDKIVVSSVIAMASKMKMAVICEGVETREQIDFLYNTDCDMVQGYFFSRPIPMEEFDSFREMFDKEDEKIQCEFNGRN